MEVIMKVFIQQVLKPAVHMSNFTAQSLMFNKLLKSLNDGKKKIKEKLPLLK